MALEDKIQELIEAVNKNTAVTENLTALRSDAIEAVKGAAKPAAAKEKPKAAAKEEPKQNIQTGDENREDPVTVNERFPHVIRGSGDENREEPADGSPNHDDLGTVIKSFMGMDDDADRRAARAALVKKLFAHDSIKAAKHTDVPADKIALVIKNIENQQTKLKAEYEAADADTGGDDLLGD